MKQWLKKAITNPWLRRYILVGYAAKGTIYLLIGILAVQAAVIPNREALGTYLTLSSLTSQPLGKLLVCVLAIALTGYVLRRIFQTILISEQSNFGNLKSIVRRLGYIMSGLSYAGVTYSALGLVFGSGEYDDTIEDLASQLFDQAIGEWLIFLGGIMVITVGLGYVYGAYTGSYISDFQSDDIHHQLEKWATRIGKLGVAARGLAFVATGILLIEAAILGSSELAGGLQNALRVLAASYLGWLWLTLIGCGFICYGLYMYVVTLYRRHAIK